MCFVYATRCFVITNMIKHFFQHIQKRESSTGKQKPFGDVEISENELSW